VPGHPEELNGEEHTAQGDNAENGPFGNGHCPNVRYIVHYAVIHIGTSEIEHDDTRQTACDKHDAVEIALGFFMDMRIDDIRNDMPAISQEPGCCQKDYPQESIFGRLHNPDSGGIKQVPHSDRVTDGSADKDENYPGQGCHDIQELIEGAPKNIHELHFPFFIADGTLPLFG
jgi:hypothetical protein